MEKINQESAGIRGCKAHCPNCKLIEICKSIIHDAVPCEMDGGGDLVDGITWEDHIMPLMDALKNVLYSPR